MGTKATDMAQFLPEKVRIAKTPDITYPVDDGRAVALYMETVELKTIDVINTFMSLKQQAMAEAYRITCEKRRKVAISKIESMAHVAP